MSREAWGDPPDPDPQCCPNCGESQHTAGCEVCDLDLKRIAAEGEAARLRYKVRELELTEQGAKEAFGHVVQDKRDLEAEVRRLQTLLDGAHQIIREYATGQRLPNNTDPRP